MLAPLETLDELLIGGRHEYVRRICNDPQPEAPGWWTRSATLCDLPPPPTVAAAAAAATTADARAVADAPPAAAAPPASAAAPYPISEASRRARFPPTLVYTCWYDVFMPQAVADYEAVAPHQPACRLVVGAHDHWATVRLNNLQVWFRLMLDSLDAHMPLSLIHI